MKNYIGRIVLLVEDYDEALDFYAKNFGFKKLWDDTHSDGQRFLHVGTEEEHSIGIWFLKYEGRERKQYLGKQSGGQPTMVIYTTDLKQLHSHLKSNNVRIKVEPVLTSGYKFLHCFDLYGNEIVAVELEK